MSNGVNGENAVGVEELVPLSPVWCVYRRPIRCLDGSQRRWERLSSADSDVLETAYQEDSDLALDLQFGRYMGNAVERCMQAHYWGEDRWPLVRGTWFWKDTVTGSICPFGEADAATLEEAYVDLMTGLEDGPIDCELIDNDVVSGVVQFVHEVIAPATDRPVPTESPKRKLVFTLYRSHVGSTRTERMDVFRGYPVPWEPTSEEQLRPDMSQLVLVIHGIGEALYNRESDPLMGAMRFRGHCDLFRENLNQKLLESFGSETGRIEVLPLEWSEFVHSRELDRRLESVSLTNLTGVRDFANLALTDVFLYTQKDVQHQIVSELRDRIFHLVEQLKTRFGLDFLDNVPVSFVGHSLGAVVLHDLIKTVAAESGTSSLPRRSFAIKPVALFLLGSPLSLFLTVRDPSRRNLHSGEETESSGTSTPAPPLLPLPVTPNCRLYNIFHPYDAIAYRLEPLIDQVLKEEEPGQVPYKGGTRVHVALRKSVADFKTAIASFGEWVYAATNRVPEGGVAEKNDKHIRTSVLNNNFNERIDWTLQESAVESMSEWMSAMGSHFTYWRHDDVHNFIINKLTNIARIKSTQFI